MIPEAASIQTMETDAYSAPSSSAMEADRSFYPERLEELRIAAERLQAWEVHRIQSHLGQLMLRFRPIPVIRRLASDSF
jgi:hypothetical protein